MYKIDGQPTLQVSFSFVNFSECVSESFWWYSGPVALCVTKQRSLVEEYQGFGSAIPQGCTNTERQVVLPLNIYSGA